MNSLLRVLCLLLAISTTSAWAAAPKITNPAAVPAAAGAATLSARVTASSASPVRVFFDYGTTTSYGTTVETAASPNADSEFVTILLSGLTTGTTYHFRVRAETTEGEKAATADQTFVQSATVTLSPAAHNATTGAVTLRGVVTSNGIAGTAYFEYGPRGVFTDVPPGVPLITPVAPVIVLPAVVGQEITAPIPAIAPVADLRGGPVYDFRLVFKPNDGALAEVRSATIGKTNTAPKAVADSTTLTSAESLTIAVLENDSDAESDTLTIKSVTPPRYGTATINGTSIVYKAKQELLVADTFRYTIEDGFTGTASATVTIRPLRAVLAGTHGGIIRDSEGNAIGYFRITATALGSFTGVIQIEGKSYLLSGSFAANGSFHGAASRDGKILPVDLTTVTSDTGTTIRAEFAQGKYTTSVEFTEDEATTRGPLAGKYTVELPGGSTGTTDGTGGTDTTTPTVGSTVPEGTGWTALKVAYDGSVRVKGRLPDGRSFSTRGALVVGPEGPQITFYDDPDGTRVVGTFNVGDTVTGTLQVDQKSSKDSAFPAGYGVTLNANGARYVSPKDGGGITSSTGGGTQNLTITFTGGGIESTFSRNLLLTDSDQIKVLNGGREDLRVKVDSSNGRFTTKVTVDDSGKRLKGTGVFIQAGADGSGGSGGGVFKGPNKPGSIQITGGSTPIPATPPPVVLPTPNPNATPVGIDFNLRRR